MRGVLLFASLFTFIYSWWLTPYKMAAAASRYVLRCAVDVSIALVPLATIISLFLHLSLRAERWLWPGAIALIGVAIRELVQETHSTHLEGFVLFISLALQDIFMRLFLGRAHRLVRRESNDTDRRFSLRVVIPLLRCSRDTAANHSHGSGPDEMVSLWVTSRLPLN